MNDWSYARLGDCVDTVETWHPGRDAPGATLTYVDLSAIDQDEKRIVEPRMVPTDDAPSRARQRLRTNDVLVSTVRPNLNGVAVVPEDLDGATASTGFCVLRSNGKRLDARYLFNWVRSPSFIASMVREATGQSYPAVSDNIVCMSKIPLPPLAEQRRIAAVLDAAEALRAKRRAAIDQLDQLAQSIFIDMFGDPVSNPNGWKARTCASIADRITVGIVVKPASYYVPTGVPALRSLNVRRGYVSLDDLVFFSKADNETKLAKTRLRQGDIVLIRSGQPGTAAVIPPELHGVNAIDLLIVTPKPAAVYPRYLCDLFNSAAGRRLVLSEQRGQIQKHLNVGSLNECLIPLPPLDLQREYSSRLTSLERLKAAQQLAITKLNDLFASLQHGAFRGGL